MLDRNFYVTNREAESRSDRNSGLERESRGKDRSFVSRKKRRKNRGISKRGCESSLSSAAFLDSIFALRITKQRKGENCNFVASVMEDSVGRRQFYEINAVRAFSTDFQMGENRRCTGKMIDFRRNISRV